MSGALVQQIFGRYSLIVENLRQIRRVLDK